MDGRIAALLMDAARDIIDRDEIEGPYERAMCAVLKSEPINTFGHEDVTGIPWIEIDFPNDLKKATSKVFPRISDYMAQVTVTEITTDD